MQALIDKSSFSCFGASSPVNKRLADSAPRLGFTEMCLFGEESKAEKCSRSSVRPARMENQKPSKLLTRLQRINSFNLALPNLGSRWEQTNLS